MHMLDGLYWGPISNNKQSSCVSDIVSLMIVVDISDMNLQTTALLASMGLLIRYIMDIMRKWKH